MATAAYEGWAILDLLGHVRLAGRVSEVSQYGVTMGRIDIPDVPATETSPAIPGFSRFFGGSSVYSMTPTTEEIAVAFTRKSRPVPVQRYDLALPALGPAPPDAEVVDEDEQDVGGGF